MTERSLAVAGSAVFTSQIVIAAHLAWRGPAGPVPLHFDWRGNVDRWGDRWDVVGLLLVLTALFGATFAICLAAERRGLSWGGGARGPRQAAILTLIVSGALTLLLSALTWGALRQVGDAQIAGQITFGVILLSVGAVLGKLGPNPLIGVRTPWAFASRLAWEKSNRLAGRLLFWLGLAALLTAPVAPQPGGLMCIGLGALFAVVAAAVESWRIWRADPERR